MLFHKRTSVALSSVEPPSDNLLSEVMFLPDNSPTILAHLQSFESKILCGICFCYRPINHPSLRSSSNPDYIVKIPEWWVISTRLFIWLVLLGQFIFPVRYISGSMMRSQERGGRVGRNIFGCDQIYLDFRSGLVCEYQLKFWYD